MNRDNHDKEMLKAIKSIAQSLKIISKQLKTKNEDDEQGKADERNYILNALANFWGQKQAEEFREWLDDGTDEFYQ